LPVIIGAAGASELDLPVFVGGVEFCLAPWLEAISGEFSFAFVTTAAVFAFEICACCGALEHEIRKLMEKTNNKQKIIFIEPILIQKCLQRAEPESEKSNSLRPLRKTFALFAV
jgi:hypothetical protein